MSEKKSTAKPKQPALPATYEQAMQELEQLVSQIESGQMPLEQLLDTYQRGADLLRFCNERLAAVEEQIRILDNGNARPWTQTDL